ncbi:MAG: homocysteine S-methyltransferase family protein [Phycisphaerae bacterium]|jgi:methionine synthase I (cobalamin-dependent)
MALNLREYVGTVRVTDGATGTQLAKLGLSAGSASELWNVTNPSAVEQVARNYIKAGSDIVLTNTLCANRYMMSAHGLTGRTAELAEAGVLVARRAAAAAAGRDVKVFASLGPTGKIVMTEEVKAEDLLAAFAESAEALAFGGADAIVIETFNELEEARLALQACKCATDLPVIVCMTFASGPDKTRTMMGNSPQELAKMAKAGGADAIGANCGAGPETYVKVAQMLRDASDLPIWIKPNAGLPTVGKDGKTHFPMAPAEFASYVPALLAAGANFIGGCCGTGPGHIEALRAEVDKLIAK